MIDPSAHFNFQEITRPEPGRAVVRWCVPVELPYFDGHFPGSPILPAVAIVDASLQFARVLTADPRLQLAEVRSAKFLKPVTPRMNLEIEAQFNSLGEDGVRWRAEWRDLDPAADRRSVAEVVFLVRSDRLGG